MRLVLGLALAAILATNLAAYAQAPPTLGVWAPGTLDVTNYEKQTYPSSGARDTLTCTISSIGNGLASVGGVSLFRQDVFSIRMYLTLGVNWSSESVTTVYNNGLPSQVTSGADWSNGGVATLTLLGTAATSGSISFDYPWIGFNWATGESVQPPPPAGLNKLLFHDFQEKYNATTQTLSVSFTVAMPNCTVLVKGVFHY
jgi:hypothetical protein